MSITMHSKAVSQEKMWMVIEEYGLKRDLLEKSQPTNWEIMQLYQMIKKNERLKKDIQQVRHLKEYKEKLKSHNDS